MINITSIHLACARHLLFIGLLSAGFHTIAQDKHAEENNASKTLPVYHVAVDNYPPFAFNNDKGQAVGFDKDILDAIGKKQGFTVTFSTEKWDGIFNLLDNKTRDIVASGVTVTEERQQKMDFSSPYLSDGIIVVIKGQPEYHEFADLKKATIGVQSGSSKIKELEAFYGKGSTKIKTFDTTEKAFQAVLRDEIDGVFAGEANLRYAITALANDTAGKESLRFIRYPTEHVSHSAYAVRKNRKDNLLNQLNHGLRQIQKDGTYQNIHEKWFGVGKSQ